MDTIMDPPSTRPAAMAHLDRDATAPSCFSLRRLSAERLSEAHLPVLRGMHRNEHLIPMPGGMSDTEIQACLALDLAHWSEHGFGIWILRDPATGRVLGRAGLRHISVEGATEVEIHCALFPEFWGRGLATDAARACVTIGRDWMGFPSLVALTQPANLAAQRVLRKAALVREREVMHGGLTQVLFRTD